MQTDRTGMQQAKTIQDIIALKNNTHLNRETVNLFYVKPPTPIANKIPRFFQAMHDHPQKMLLLGPRGSGKRTLLCYLAQNQLERFHCISIHLLSTLNPMDISQVDILFCLLLRLIDDVNQTQKRLDPSVLNNIYQQLHDEQLIERVHFKKSEAGEAEGTKIGFVQSFIRAIVEALSTSGHEIRNRIRDAFEPRIRLFIKSAQGLIDYINRTHQPDGRVLLIMFDDLGQFDQNTAELFFQNHLPLTERLNAHIIYTMPDFIRFSSFFPTLIQRLDRVEYLRITPVVNQDQTSFNRGKQYMKEVICKRIDSQLLSEDILDGIITASGGMLNDAFYLLFETAVYTLTEMPDSHVLQQDAFEKAMAHFIRQKFQQLNYQQASLLKNLDFSNTAWVGNSDISGLIMKNFLVEYENDSNVWFDTHPLVKRGVCTV